MLGLADDSALLRHEICYVLGQLRKAKAIPVLVNLLEVDRDVMVRHEAAEALGAIADPALLEKEQLDHIVMVLKVLNAAYIPMLRVRDADTWHLLLFSCMVVMIQLSFFRNLCLMLLPKSLKPAKLRLTALSGA